MSSNSSDTSGADAVFPITASEIYFANVLSGYGIMPGTCVCFVILILYGVVAYFPRARTSLDRVSFRLLVYALLSNVGFGIAYDATPAVPGLRCNLGAFCINLFLSLSTFFTTCIAINLQLVLVHHKNGLRLEKYYVIGTILLTLILNIPPLALDQFGWDEETSTCWYQNKDAAKRLHWVISTSSLWITLATTVETICSAVVLMWMFSYQRTTRTIARQAAIGLEQINKQNLKVAENTTPMPSDQIPPLKVPVDDKKRVENFLRKRSTDIMRDPRYRNAIFRIALYPIVSLMCNYPTVALDLKTTIQRGIRSQVDFRLDVLDLLIYAIRPLAYGIIAATDPSFIAAVRELLGKPCHAQNKSSSNEISGQLPEFASVSGGVESTIGTTGSTAGDLGNMDHQKTEQNASLYAPSFSNGVVQGVSQEQVATESPAMNLSFDQNDLESGSPTLDYEEEFREANRQI